MSLVVTVFVPEGIVMAADSRLTLEFQVAQPGGGTKHHSVPSSDSTYKVFLTPTRIGISIFGAASVGGTTPIGPLVEAFAADQLAGPAVSPQDAAAALLGYLRGLPGPPATRLHVAGYKDHQQQVFDVEVTANVAKQVNTQGAGAAWGGEADALSRIVSRVGALDATGAMVGELPSFGMAFQQFTLQDAIDFSIYAIQTTADTMRFQMRPQTVGGPIDVLVIRPSEARWLCRKELKARGAALGGPAQF